MAASVTTTESPAFEIEKFLSESVKLHKFDPIKPFSATCRSNTKITRCCDPVDIHHIVLDTRGEFPYREGQILGVIPDGHDKNGNPYPPSLYTIASSALGDFGDSKTVSLCVKYVPEGVASIFLRNLKRGNKVNITGPYGGKNMLLPRDPNATYSFGNSSSGKLETGYEANITGPHGGKNMLMPKDPNATILMLATDTGIARFRSFSWKMFFENNKDYKFNGFAWLFFGVPTTGSLLYKEEFHKMKLMHPLNLKLNFAIGDKEEYIETEMAKYPECIWNLIKKNNTFVYVCGLEGMVLGIDKLMESLAASAGKNWKEYKKQLELEERWNVEVY